MTEQEFRKEIFEKKCWKCNAELTCETIDHNPPQMIDGIAHRDRAFLYCATHIWSCPVCKPGEKDQANEATLPPRQES